MAPENVLAPLRDGKVTIDPEFQGLIPPLQAEELRQLEQSLRREGCRDPFVVWAERDILLDGHHRHQICTTHDIAYTTVGRSFDTEDDARLGVIQNQFGRRNLTPFQRAELALVAKPLLEATARARMVAGQPGPTQTSEEGLPERNARTTAAKLGAIAGVSRDTIAKAEVIAEHASDKVKEKLRYPHRRQCGTR